MEKNAACYLVLGIAAAGWALAGVQSLRLGQRGAELGRYRAELESAQDRFSDIADVVAGAERTLCAGTDSIAGLRGQLATLRGEYEKMAEMLSDWNSGGGPACGRGSPADTEVNDEAD